MRKIQLLKEPGYIYDLNFIFCLKFNTQLYIETLPNESNRGEAVKYFKEILNRFYDIPDDLYVFFHAHETGRCFLPTCYFNPYKDRFATDYNFTFLKKELSNQDQVIRNVIKFYFHELDENAVEECATSLQKICDCIKHSQYSGEEKAKLYEFFINPSQHIQLLQYELMQKEVALSQYYKENYQKIIDLYNQTTVEMVCGQMQGLWDLTFLEHEHNIYVSYCLLHNFCINFFPTADGFLSMFGWQYVNILDYIKDQNTDLDLCGLGTALCEKSRVQILELLIECEEVTCKDLEKAFSFSGSTAYHHINIMTKSGIVKTRNEGKTILYSLNENYIANIINLFSKVLKRRGKRNEKNME